ncbi:hypothetical protein [Marinoscillum sp.]|uniref:carboxylesterase family protein n=1 Tax=Marinoscillum sp. TaxID=2024838 RepID=UPI003BABC37C
MKSITLGAIALVFSFAACGQSATGSEMEKLSKAVYHSSGSQIPYRWFTPADMVENRRYPLILCLHGAGERGDDNETHVNKHDLVIPWNKASHQQENPCFVLAPQCPNGQKWNYIDFGQGSFSMDTLPIGAELKAVIALLDSLIGVYPIDLNRVYVTGLSMGGYGTWDLIMREPGRFAAAIPMSGGGSPAHAHLSKEVALWVFHNTHDQIVPVAGSRDLLAALESRELPVLQTESVSKEELERRITLGEKRLYTESSTGNHGPWEVWYNDRLLHKWLFAQKKD